MLSSLEIEKCKACLETNGNIWKQMGITRFGLGYDKY